MSFEAHPAHIRISKEGIREVQTVSQHCRKTAEYAAESVRSVGLSETAYLAGLLHDLGKTKEEFRYYIENAVATGERGAKTVNHTFAGVRYMLEHYHDDEKYLAAEFMGFQDSKERERPADQASFWQMLLTRVEIKLHEFPMDTPIRKARKEISDQCRRFADRGTGICCLSVPTGAGKTLSALRFALAHAAKHNMRRVVFTAPLISILDQNAEIIQEYLQEKSAILKEWQERKQVNIEHPFLKEKVAWGQVPYVQALLLARHIRGDMDGYPPFLWK